MEASKGPQKGSYLLQFARSGSMGHDRVLGFRKRAQGENGASGKAKRARECSPS